MKSLHTGHGRPVAIAIALAVTLCICAGWPPAARAQRAFLRGNANGDNDVDISDAIFTISSLFLGGMAPPCADAADSNDDGELDISDASFLLGYLFLGTKAPPLPGPAVPGPDPSEDGLGCGPAQERAPFEPPEEPPASPSTAPKVTVRGWDPKQVKAIIGKAKSVDVLRIRGRGLDVSWVMTYRSRFGLASPGGNGWYHSYDVWIERRDPGLQGPLTLHDGTGRSDDFARGADGTYSARGFFIEGREAADGTFTFTFPDGGTWVFHPLDGTPRTGRLEAIRDRNGNRILLEYVFQENQTDLEFLRLRDTLGREVTAAFGPGGRVLRVTDFLGRQATFEYYQDGEGGGSAGDLKSMSTPPFTVGNDPPVVRTTTFTYSKGFADDRLNHNLLTVTGPRGLRELTIAYSTATDPADPGFDRAASRLEGEGGARRGQAHVFYGGPFEPFRVVSVDLAGNVDETTFDEKNRPVRLREFTGHSDPALPVTDTQNRPQGKLRPGDPDLFETSFEWDEDSLLTRTVFPEKNEVRCLYQGDVDAAASPRSRANLLEVRRLAGPRGAAQAEIVERFEHDPLTNQVTRAVDALGNEDRSEYDARGNLLRFVDRISSSVHDFEHDEFGRLTAQVGPENGSGERRRVEYEYHGPEDGAQDGTIKKVRLRLTPFDSEVGIETDAVGNIVRVVDPRGNAWEYEYDGLDELVRVTSPSLPGGLPHRVVWSAFLDLSGNVVREDVLDAGADGAVAADAQVSKVYEYDALDRLVRKHEEAGSADLGPGDRDGSTIPLAEFVTTEYEYDAAGNLALVRPIGAPGEPVNAMRLEHDERGLLYRRARGAGSAEESIDQCDYDGNGNRVRVLRAPDFLRFSAVFDGHDRLVRVEDALGNAEVLERDAGGRVVVSFDLADSTGDPADVKVKLAESHFEYDAMDRRVKVHLLTDPADPESPEVTTESSYSDASRLLRVVDPNGHETRHAYDAAGRLSSITDALGNSSTYEYDASSNLVRRTDSELVQGAASSFETRYAYDPLDRRVAMTDSLGDTVRYAYDSRSNLTEVGNAVGGSTEYRYDGLGRLVSVRRSLGAPPAPEGAAEIVDRLRWDSSSRLVEEIDPNANSVRYAYDALDRRVSTTFADGTVHRVAYDARDNPVLSTDANGTAVKYTYDPLDRLVRKDITPGPGVSGATTFEEFRHDGLSRLLEARNDSSTASFRHDALSRVTGETLDGRTTSCEYDAAGNLISLTYPGGEVIRYAHDALGREVSVGRGDDCCAIVHSAEYAGPSRLLSRSLANGLTSRWEFDGARQVVRALHERGPAAEAVVDRRHGWDAMHRQAARADALPGGIAHEYAYDPAHRLVQSSFTVPGTPPRVTSYSLDPASNRVEVTGAVDPGRYLLDPTLPEPADFQVDQYTSTPFDQRAYDRDGNALRFGRPLRGRVVEVAASYDYAGRLVEVADLATGEKVSYAYDALGRRSSSTAGGVTGPRSFHGMDLIEDRRKGAVYIYSGGHPIVMEEGGQDLFLLHDGAGDAAALADGQGNLVEAYEFGDFGEPRIFDPQGSPMPASKVANPFLRDGLEHDGDTGLYHAPREGVHFDPRAGRNVNGGRAVGSGFVRSDPAGGGIPGHGDVSDFGMSRKPGRDSDGLVFNVVNPRAARLAAPGGDGLKEEAHFQEVTGLGVSIDVLEYQEGGKNDGAHKRPGATRYSNIVLKRGVTKSKAFFDWVASAANREVKRMGGKISLCRRDGSPVIEWTFEKGWPCRYEGPRFDASTGELRLAGPGDGGLSTVKWEGPDFDASKNEVSIETIEIAHHGFAAESVGFPGKPLRGRVPVSFAVTDPEARTGPSFEVPRPSRPPADRFRMSDNGWGNCFNCHPFGLADHVQGPRLDERRFQTLSNASKTKHDTVKNSINNVR